MVKNYPSEQLIAHLFDAQPESVVWFIALFDDKQPGKITDFEARYCNKATAAAFAVAPQEIIGASILSSPLMSEKSRRQLFDQCLYVWTTGEELTFTYYDIQLDKYFRVTRSKVQDGILSVSRNCTEEIKAELRRKEQETKFQQLLDASGDGVLLLEAMRDSIGNIVDFHIAFCNKYGYKIGRFPHDAVGKSLFQVLPHMRDHEQLSLHKKVIETGEPIQFETTFRTQEGEEYGWFIVSLTRLGDGVISRYTDITQRKQYERQIELQKEELAGILDSSINAVFACEAIRNKAGKIEDLLFIRVNAVFTNIMGMDAEQVTGVRFLSLFPYAKRAGTFDAFCKVIMTGKNLRTETYYKDEKFTGWLDISAVKRGNNGIVVSFTDVTPIKETQRQLEKTIVDLKRTNKRLEEFTFAASHDLQEPLRKIQLFNGRLRSALSSVSGEDYQVMFEKIETSVNRMRMLIENLMAFANVHQQAEAFKPVSVKGVIEEVVCNLEAVIEEKSATIQVDEMPVVQGNKGQLCQLFQNLIGNSLKYAKAGLSPHIVVRSTLVTGADVESFVNKADAEKKYRLFEVKDNGIGFDMKYNQKIFQVFQRLHGKLEYKGAGIGLAIVQKVVENHSGYVWAESQPGEGATFKIVLPVR